MEIVYSVESVDGKWKWGRETWQIRTGEERWQDAKLEDTKVEAKPKMKLAMFKRRESETTEYSCSTDSESQGIIFSQTDCQSNWCSEVCLRRSSSGSQPNINEAGSMEDLRGQMKLIDRRRNFLQHNQSISLDLNSLSTPFPPFPLPFINKEYLKLSV